MHPFIIFIFLCTLIHSANPLSFNFSSFDNNPECSGDQKTRCIDYQGDAFFNKAIQLTKNQLGTPITDSSGRAIFAEPLVLWDKDSGEVADFTTHFTFIINALNSSVYGDGLAFFLTPYSSTIPENSSGGALGLFEDSKKFNRSANEIVAVEFDSFQNEWDPSSDHLGININSIVSVTNKTWPSSMKDGRIANAWITYNASAMNFSVFLSYESNNLNFNGNSSLSYIVDFREILPEMVSVGFSASTGRVIELHSILSWEFSSSLVFSDKSNKVRILVGVCVGVVVLLVILLVFAWLVLWKRKTRRRRRRSSSSSRMEEDDNMDVSINDELGAKRFPYNELVAATKDFREDWKIGEGGFGDVYKGFLPDLNLEVAIKRISRSSKQGKKEFISEVKIISKLRHRNLVQLIGWCQSKGDLLLVYEFMQNGSLDKHLYSEKCLLPWPVRYKIALGLASALLYIHEQWEQCIVHRDIKPSNVMLDAWYNVKLGDFGLARLIEQGRGSQTTILAGTMGYLAPECVVTGKASKETDVYGFGVVALEICSGRRPFEPKEEQHKVKLVEWVWELYGRKIIFDAADSRLETDFDKHQMERLLVVGLWCAHPDYNLRPSIRQVLSVLNYECALPELPAKMPLPMYFAPALDAAKLVYGSQYNSSVEASISAAAGNNNKNRNKNKNEEYCVSNDHDSGGYVSSSYSSMSPGSSPSLHLLTHKSLRSSELC
ncbi:Non-specific serine/threonine protein kinase protein [Dioscorea alata]|uniref:Non-specific serine/threonine protein kinase protein n=1 Tax=Dioscorea alata TaxID=55571 RepID=A0ACB7VN54_DIOAL|nr:Non-specific serine/threonine protein kinase protein [Dioscorea alata]